MTRALFVAILAITVSGCNTTPQVADLDIEVTGDYATLADCVYLDLIDRPQPYEVQKVPFESMGKTRLLFGIPSYISGQMEFIGQPGNRTRIVFKHQRAVYGSDFFANRYRPSIDRCL